MSLRLADLPVISRARVVVVESEWSQNCRSSIECAERVGPVLQIEWSITDLWIFGVTKIFPTHDRA